MKYEAERYFLTSANLDRGDGLLWRNLVNGGSGWQPNVLPAAVEDKRAEVVTTDHGIRGR